MTYTETVDEQVKSCLDNNNCCHLYSLFSMLLIIKFLSYFPDMKEPEQPS